MIGQECTMPQINQHKFSPLVGEQRLDLSVFAGSHVPR